MIVLAGFILGATGGALRARKDGGKPLDMLQYAAAYGILFALVGLFVTIVIGRMA